jgi:flagellar biosynthesis GTPase FlhF
MQEARSNPQQRASMNQGKPQVAATARPGDFKGSGVVQAKEAGGAYTPRAGNSNAHQPRQNGSPASHVRDLPPVERPAAPSTRNPKMDKKYQQQQEKQYAAQQKERQKLQQQQEKEDQKLAKQNADEARKQQVEQRHQQQTQQLQQRHEQQRQQMQQRMQPPPERGSERRPPQ